MWYETLLEKNLIPDFLLRRAIRLLNKRRLQQETLENEEKQSEHFQEILQLLKNSPIAVETDKANEQHYELPAEFYSLCLGENRKYSCCYYPNKNTTLDEAEKIMLELSCQRAELRDGMDILELGCGWGSLTLFMAKKFPNSKIVAVSNSQSQRAYIESRLQERNLQNVQVITEDMNTFQTKLTFDRVVSIEMFEHMRNYEKLMQNIASWLKEDGKLFVHIFVHRSLAYLFEVKDETDWMSRYFFTGGIMPSNHLLAYFQKDLLLEKHWHVDGTHYQKTSEDWLKNLDANKKPVLEIFRRVYGEKEAVKWFVYWRIFFMAVAELFGTKQGREWFVSHYLFAKKELT